MKGTSVSIKFVINVLLKNIIWLVLAAVIGGSGLYLYTKHTAVTMYTSSIKLLVRNTSLQSENDEISLSPSSSPSSGKTTTTSTIAASKALINTYIEILKTQNSLNMFVEELKATQNRDEATLDESGVWWIDTVSPGYIKGTMSMYPLGETEILQINITTTEGYKSKAICTAIEKIAPQVINDLYDIGSVRVIESTTEPASSYISYTNKVLIGAAAGFGLVAAIVFFIAYFDNTIKSEEEIKEIFQVLTLGEIPDFSHEDEAYKKYYHHYDDYGKRRRD